MTCLSGSSIRHCWPYQSIALNYRRNILLYMHYLTNDYQGMQSNNQKTHCLPVSQHFQSQKLHPSGTRNCDCAFAEIRKDGLSFYLYITDESKIWKASNTYWTITSKKGSDQTPGDTAVRFMGIISGEKSGTVVTVNAQVLGGTYGTLNGQTLATFTGQSGDSGAPVFSPGTTNVTFYGILVGNYKIGSTTYGVYSPWQHIKSELNLTS